VTTINVLVSLAALLAFMLDSIGKSLALRRQKRQLRSLVEWVLDDLPDLPLGGEGMPDGEAWSAYSETMRDLSGKIERIAEGKPWGLDARGSRYARMAELKAGIGQECKPGAKRE
jgi:hypothetical protein